MAHGVTVGHPTLYFANNSPSGDYRPFPEAQGCNRLSFYYKTPAELDNGEGGYSARPATTMNVGPFNGEGGHWYHEICTQGGGWTHVTIDGHPQHNNSFSSADLYPLPSSAIPDMGVDYFNGWYRWYVTFKPYGGVATAPYEIFFDEFRFLYDPEPQNNETINSPSVTWLPDAQHFEIGFMDKYKNNQYAHCTYELRYSFSPIDNANWNQAAPAHILADPRFYLTERADGKFAKHWPHYAAVWAPFTLATEDLAQLTPGRLIFFALKDISQQNGDGPDPIDYSVSSYWSVGGRDYTNHGDTFDYAGDAAVLPLIKRIDFRMPQSTAPGQGSLTVEISPPSAAGVRWRRQGASAWRGPGETESGIQEGDYLLEFSGLDGFRDVADTLARVRAGETASVRVHRPRLDPGLTARYLLLP